MKKIYIMYSGFGKSAYKIGWANTLEEVNSYMHNSNNLSVDKISRVHRYKVETVSPSFLTFIKSFFLDKSFDDLKKAKAYREELYQKGILSKIYDLTH
jgi:hypothetical protein